LENDIDFDKDGSALESHPAFPKNILRTSFTQII
jgi:hypothetical protein